MIPSCTEESLRVWEPGGPVENLASELHCSPFLASLLWMKGITPDSADTGRKTWLSPDLGCWLSQIDLGASASSACDLWSSIGEGSSVVVYGDYDVDGIAATTFMMELALLKGASVRYYIPHRFNQGYGFHPDVVETIARTKRRCDLLVVVDCGTQSTEAALVARSRGIPVIIFDHHLARGDFAASEALINPHIDGNDLARHLCAAGVVWSWAWKNELAPQEWLMQRLDITALATVADCVPMSSPVNRAIVREGIRMMRISPRRGLASLMRGMCIDISTLDTDSLAMRLIPCLNAAGRLELADLAMKIFFPSGDIEEHVATLINLNQKRRDMSTRIVNDVESALRSNSGFRHVLYGEDWPAGVLSSVASRVCAQRDIPVVLAAPAQRSIVRGTLRVPPGGDAEVMLGELSGDLVSWGGHRMAAGFSVESEKWPDVRCRLERILAGASLPQEKQDILRWSPANLDISSWKEAERLGPFGVGNSHPLLYCSQEGEICAEPLGRKGNHVRIFVEGCALLGFSGEHLLSADCAPSGWVYKPRIDFWRCSENLQLVLEKVVVPAA